MLLNRTTILLIFLLPVQAWSAYDASHLKIGISKNQSAFHVEFWKQSANKQHWVASTSLKRVVISIGDKKAVFIAPFINPQQMKIAKRLCAEFALTAIDPGNEEILKKIQETIKHSTTRHQMKYYNANNIKFSVAPKLIGAVVSLHCSLNAIEP